MTKCCTRCGLVKDINNFYKHKKCKGGLYSQCKNCCVELGTQYRQTEKGKESYRKHNRNYQKTEHGKKMRENCRKTEKTKFTDRKRHLQKTYGLTLEQYDEMFEKQNGVCAVCSNINLCGKRLHVDHNHETGEIRGLLCSNCNLLLGRIENTPELFKNLMAYLDCSVKSE